MSEEAITEPAQPPTLAELFWLCFRVGVTSFGGGLSGWFYREFVQTRQWITDEEFMSTWSICQMLPGPNVVNLLVCVGHELRGFAGACVCAFGFLIGPFFFVIGLNATFDALSRFLPMQSISSGIAFTAVGLLVVICLRGVQRGLRFPPSLVIIAITAITVGILHWSLFLVVLCVAPISVAMAWRRV